MARRPAPKKKKEPRAEDYRHRGEKSPMRPDAGTQAQFKKKKPPATYRYDSSLAPEMNWDGQNPARELGEWLLDCVEEAARLPEPHLFPQARVFQGGDGRAVESVAGLHEAVAKLKALGAPFLDWAGKAERLSFDVPTLPLFVHERLSTQVVIQTLKGHRKDSGKTQAELFADPQRPITDQVLRAYEYKGDWANRLVLGDSLAVMNSLLQYEGLGGQVQMIYMDPPYGVKFGSNFQPFVRRRDVKDGDDDHITREPEMVQAYRDTWELGLHSYLSYLRDRLLLCRELLAPTGSIFVQIGDENVHHVREVMDEVFGETHRIVTIVLKKKGATTATDPVNDFILWYSKDKEKAKKSFNRLFARRSNPVDDPKFNTLISPDGQHKRVKDLDPDQIQMLQAKGWKWARVNYPLVSQEYQEERSTPYEFSGKTFYCGDNRHWSFNVPEGMDRLADAGRLFDGGGQSLGGIVYWNDWPYAAISNVWNDLKGEENPEYVVQTSWRAIERCLLMSTNPGDLVLDPTCGSGTTPYVAEQWGRRWIGVDVSRVPLALARQRILTATFPWYELQDEGRGPSGGFVYRRKRNKKGEEVGGLVPHITLKSIANNEEPKTEVLVDRPEVDGGITRVSGPFAVEATIPAPAEWGEGEASAEDPGERGACVDRMLEILRKSPVLRFGGNRTATLKNVRPPAKTLSLSAEAMVKAADLGPPKDLGELEEQALDNRGGRLPLNDKPVAIVFGPENGAASEKLVWEAAREAHAKGYAALFVIGFAIQPNARKLVEECESAVGVPAYYIQATPDLMMGDLLKNMRSSQIFSVCGLPDVKLRVVSCQLGETANSQLPTSNSQLSTSNSQLLYQVELLGLDVFDPGTMDLQHRRGEDVPAWFLDTDYNNLCFHVCQAFFPRTGAWENIKKALKGTYDEGVWDHLSGTASAPFEAGGHGQVAVKVIDDRGNELLVVKSLGEAEG